MDHGPLGRGGGRSNEMIQRSTYSENILKNKTISGPLIGKVLEKWTTFYCLFLAIPLDSYGNLEP